MTTSAISGNAPAFQPPPQLSQFRQGFGQLVASIQSGDLLGAQDAYAALSKLQGNGQGPASDPNSPFAKALAQIGQDLQNNDLAGANQVLSALAQQTHEAHHHHHHGGSQGGGAPSGAAVPPASPGPGGINIVA
jgi:hypothetical protein